MVVAVIVIVPIMVAIEPVRMLVVMVAAAVRTVFMVSMLVAALFGVRMIMLIGIGGVVMPVIVLIAGVVVLPVIVVMPVIMVMVVAAAGAVHMLLGGAGGFACLSPGDRLGHQPSFLVGGGRRHIGSVAVRRVIVPMVMPVSMSGVPIVVMVVSADGAVAVGAALRLERGVDETNLGAEPFHHFDEHVVVADPQCLAEKLRRGVAIAEMPGDAQDNVGIVGAEFDQPFRFCRDDDEPAWFQLEGIAGSKRRRLCEIDEEFGSLGGNERATAAAAVVEIQFDAVDDVCRVVGAGREDAGRSDHGAFRWQRMGLRRCEGDPPGRGSVVPACRRKTCPNSGRIASTGGRPPPMRGAGRPAVNRLYVRIGGRRCQSSQPVAVGVNPGSSRRSSVTGQADGKRSRLRPVSSARSARAAS